MSQGVVTNYFAKKRRGGYIQPSKRLKLDGETRAEKSLKDETRKKPEGFVCEIRATRRSTRSSSKTSRRRGNTTSRPGASGDQLTPSLDKYFAALSSVPEPDENLTLQLSPGSSDSGSSVRSEIVTAANDDHDSPQTPKRRHGKGQKDSDESVREKRGRATPKKLGFDFQVSENIKTAELLPNTEFPAVKRQRQKGTRKKLILPGNHQESEKDPPPKLNTAPEKNANTMSGKPTQAKEVPASLSKRVTRSRKNATSEIPGQTSTVDFQKTNDLAKKLLAKKKDSPDTLKEVLKSSGNLKDLQETLMKIRDQKKKQKEKEKVKKTQKKKIPEEPKKEIVATEKREFAYETLHSLAQEIPKGLSLPYKYKILAELFRCADTVVSMLFNRQQVTTWNSLQKSVKEMARKNFELDHLGQIKSVFPLAYQYRQEKGLISYTDHIRPSDYQLTIEPVLDATGSDNFGEGSRKLTSGMLVKRKHHFVTQLVNIVKEHHKKFLSTLDPPVHIQDEKIVRWHPQFPLDRVPDVDKAELPNPPDHDKGRCNSAKEVLDKARSKFTKKAVDALKKVAEKAASTPEKPPKHSVEENNNVTPSKTPTPVKPPSALKGVSQSLLMKIRAKEAEKKIKSMVRSEDSAKRLEMLAKLPDVARALRMLYVTEKKAALPLEYVSEKLVKCCSGILTPVVVQEHVILLEQHLPTWLNRTKVRNISYIRMDKGKEMAEIITHLQEKIKEAEKTS